MEIRLGRRGRVVCVCVKRTRQMTTKRVGEVTSNYTSISFIHSQPLFPPLSRSIIFLVPRESSICLIIGSDLFHLRKHSLARHLTKPTDESFISPTERVQRARDHHFLLPTGRWFLSLINGNRSTRMLFSQKPKVSNFLL
jgi:hypothetical protein